MCEVERNFLKKYHNAFLHIDSYNIGFVWCYYRQSDSSNVIHIDKIYKGNIVDTYEIPYPKSTEWIYNLSEQNLKFYQSIELDPNAFRMSIKQGRKIVRYESEMNPIRISEFKDSFKISARKYYDIKYGPEHYFTQKYKRSDSTMVIPMDSFYLNLAQDLRKYVFPEVYGWDDETETDSMDIE